VKPFYFGNSQKPLFGIYHPPAVERSRSYGIVLSCPIGHEYLYAYRAFRQLAIQLARSGFPVLRFDYYGCGDSAGESDEGNVNQWKDDVSRAIDELKDASKLSKMCLVGGRLGATLSVLVGGQRDDLEGIVLWDPIVNGKEYVQELTRCHQNWLDEQTLKPTFVEGSNQQSEVLGFPLTSALRDGLENVDLLAMRRCPAKYVLIVEGNNSADACRLGNHLKKCGAYLDYQNIASSQIWLRKRGGDNALVPAHLLRTIVSWFCRIAT
jgi:pimeloyl-ACP methyl ester carboxylesterase